MSFIFNWFNRSSTADYYPNGKVTKGTLPVNINGKTENIATRFEIPLWGKLLPQLFARH